MSHLNRNGGTDHIISYQEDGFLILMDGTRAYKYLREDWLNHEMATSKPCKIASYKEDALDHSYKLLFGTELQLGW